MHALCVGLCVCPQVPLQIERPSPGRRKLHRGSIHTAAALSPAQGGMHTHTHTHTRTHTHTHTHIQSDISLVNAGSRVLLLLTTSPSATNKSVFFLLDDKWSLHRLRPNDEAPWLFYGVASATAARSLWWLMLWGLCACVSSLACAWVCVTSFSFHVFYGTLRGSEREGHGEKKGVISGRLSSSLCLVSLHQSKWIL